MSCGTILVNFLKIKSIHCFLEQKREGEGTAAICEMYIVGLGYFVTMYYRGKNRKRV